MKLPDIALTPGYFPIETIDSKRAVYDENRYRTRQSAQCEADYLNSRNRELNISVMYHNGKEWE